MGPSSSNSSCAKRGRRGLFLINGPRWPSSGSAPLGVGIESMELECVFLAATNVEHTFPYARAAYRRRTARFMRDTDRDISRDVKKVLATIYASGSGLRPLINRPRLLITHDYMSTS